MPPAFQQLSGFYSVAAAPVRADILYAANFGDNTIEKFTSGGGSLFASIGDCLSTPEGLAFDSAGNLYVGNVGNNTIVKLTPSGAGSLFASTGLNIPAYLAFTDDSGVPLPLANQLPEPAAASLALLGGLALLRRRWDR